MKWLNKAIIVVAAVFATSSVYGDTVRLATEGAYPPYNIINEHGEVDGFERDVGDELCRRAKLVCVWVTNEWDSIIPNLVSSNYDAILAGMSITAERDDVIDFTQEYFPPDPSAYVGLAGAGSAALGGYVAAQTNTIQASYVAASGAILQEFASPDETIAAIRSGEADAVLADKSFLAPIVAESNGTLAFIGDDVVIGGGVGVGVRESDLELKSKLNAAISAMKADGSLNALIKKWFDDQARQF